MGCKGSGGESRESHPLSLASFDAVGAIKVTSLLCVRSISQSKSEHTKEIIMLSITNTPRREEGNKKNGETKQKRAFERNFYFWGRDAMPLLLGTPKKHDTNKRCDAACTNDAHWRRHSNRRGK